jgi:23S rRNA pseudouridine1911/1915/1917 synthase
MSIVVANCVISGEQAGRLDRVVQHLTGRSRADVRGLFDHGCVRLNGAASAEAGTLVQPGDRVVVRHDPHRRYHERRRPASGNVFRLVFEDEHLVVVDKAAPFLTVPTDRHESNTVVEALNRHVSRSRRRGRVAVVHRLDRGTSGLLVFAKSTEVAGELHAQFRARKTEREYAAIVAGELHNDEGTFSSRIATARKSLRRFSVRDGDRGEYAVTHYRVERQLRDATFVRVWLETGRRNQIRVHFAEARHPVLGDKRYEPQLAQHRGWTARRLALHAAVLTFTHPRTGQQLKFESPLPDEFVHFLNRQSRRSSS